MNDKTLKFQNKLNQKYNNEYIVLEEYINQTTKIKVKHLKCNNEFYIYPKSFISSRHKGCNFCRLKNKTKTNEMFINEMYNLVGDEYKLLTKYNKSNIKVKIKHNICGYEYYVTPSHFLRGERCPKCYGKNRKTTCEWQNEMNSISNNEYEVLEDYINNRTPILTLHKKCGNIWKISPSNFKKGHRCPKCAAEIIAEKLSFSHDDICNKIYKIVGNEYKILDTYKNNCTKIRFIHNKCGYIYSSSVANFLKGNRCPHCKVGSKGEEIIKKYLLDNNIKFKREYYFNDLRGSKNKPLRFDFCILDNDDNIKMLLEYDGRQHYIYEKSSFISYEDFINTKKRDKMKNDYCIKNNILLLRINYNYYNDLENILKLIILEKDSETIRKFMIHK